MKLFVDRDLGPAVARAIRDLGYDVVDHFEQFAPDSLDTEWIPAVTADGRIILSKDRKQRTGPEREAVEAYGARLYSVTSDGMGTIDLLRALLLAWPHLELWAERPGPWMFRIARDGTPTQWVPADAPGSAADRRQQLNDARQRKVAKKMERSRILEEIAVDPALPASAGGSPFEVPPAKARLDAGPPFEEIRGNQAELFGDED